MLNLPRDKGCLLAGDWWVLFSPRDKGCLLAGDGWLLYSPRDKGCLLAGDWWLLIGIPGLVLGGMFSANKCLH